MTKRIFDINPWKLTTTSLKADEIRLYESLTSIGNGYMGMRGNFEEGFSGNSHKGTYIAGVWFPDKTRVGWWKNGYPKYFGKVINALNFACINIEINNQIIDLNKIDFSGFYEELDLHNGLLTRSYIVNQKETNVRLVFRRFFSIVERRTAEFEISFEVLKGEANIKVGSVLDGDVRNLDSNYDERFWNIEDKYENYLSMRTKTNPFGTPCFTVSAAMKNQLNTKCVTKRFIDDLAVCEEFSFELNEKEKAVFNKMVSVITDRDTPIAKHKELAFSLLNGLPFDEKLKEQTFAWKKRWDNCDVVIEGDDESLQGIRFNIFQLFSTYYGEDSRLNIGPKGFTGEKYGGATYWDTEAYILPMYLSTAEREVNEKLLRYRYDQLDGAKHNAKEQGLNGALYPMVTFTGVECHNEWEITFEEIHRNGAIAYAIYNYTNYTGDESYIENYGIEELVELSRFWASRVHYSTLKEKYMIHGVTGPNEYENNVNNNWYTNTLCKWTLEYTLEWLDKIPGAIKKYDISDNEITLWKDIANRMYFSKDDKLGIFVQHDTFLDKKLESVSAIPESDRPINQHWSWDRILRSCYIKQADVLQGIYMFSDKFTLEEKKKNFEFYEPMTVHESSLSACIHSIVASEIGKKDKAMELYLRTARLDLDNYNNDSEDGLHITSMSGGWLVVVQGFAGMRTFNGRLSLKPFCPDNWREYSFNILYRNRRVHVNITRDSVIVWLISGSPLCIKIYDREYEVTKSQIEVKVENNGNKSYLI